MQFADRRDAGRALAERCAAIATTDPVVLALPRGGVPVAYEVAQRLAAPLDVIVVRKLGVPAQPELAMGAIGEDDARVLNADVVRLMRVTPEQIAAVEAREREELARRLARYRTARTAVPIAGRSVFVGDDGIATGATARAACEIVRQRGATHVTLAAPVAAAESVLALAEVADAVVTVTAPDSFRAIGTFYRDFSPTPDAEVEALLRAAESR